MAKDPAFLFYPGDYLKDTQCLSEKSQVAYDRIMCEHMRNICITQQQLNFFTKRLSDEEKKEILFVLKKIEGGYQIEWVADSICKRKDYSKSRAENRKGKTKNISTSYDSHMENAIENGIENKVVNWNSIKTNFFNAYEWKEDFCRKKNITMPVLEKLMVEFIGDIELGEEFKPLSELKSHFKNKFNLNKNGTNKQTPGKTFNKNSAGAGTMLDNLEAYVEATRGRDPQS